MKQLTAFVICRAVLYTLDASWFGGWYVSAIKAAAHEIYVRW
jgi:hypothetical protein